MESDDDEFSYKKPVRGAPLPNGLSSHTSWVTPEALEGPNSKSLANICAVYMAFVACSL
jgi:hypothetical protein